MADWINNVELSFVKITKEFPDVLFQYYLDKLPFTIREKNKRFLRWQDRYSHLMGRILLLDFANRSGLGPKFLEQITYNKYGKPLSDQLNFSISHSAELVVCVCTPVNLSIGVDVEWKRPVELNDFFNTMDDDQWRRIYSDPESPLDKFYLYWVIKESVIKADGRGLSIPLTDVLISKNLAWVKGNQRPWHIEELTLEQEYALAIATNIQLSRENIIIREFVLGARL